MRSRTRRIVDSPVIIEQLEERQLLSLTLDVRAVGVSGSGVTMVNNKSVTVTNASVGGTITFEVKASVLGVNSTGTDDGFQHAFFRLLSSNVDSGSIRGAMSATGTDLGPVAPFNANGAIPGASQDIDGDGDLDLGGTLISSPTDMAFVRSSPMTFGTASAQSANFLVYRFKITIGSVLSGTQTDVNLQRSTFSASPLWREDGEAKTPSEGTINIGSAVVIKKAVATAGISGLVFDDLNDNGVKDATETTGLSGWTVFIDADKDGVFDSGERSTATSSTGAYSFTGLAVGTYRVRQVVKSGYRATLPSTGYHDVTLSSGQTATGKNFGDTTKVRISGTVFNDANSNGVKDSTETTGLSGWTVFIDADKDGVFDTGEKSTTTNSTGGYSFTGLAAGTYRVRHVVKSGYRVTLPSTGYHDITLSSGQISTGKNFGDTTNILISGTIFNDANGNGVKDSTETTGLSGWTVYIDADKDGVFDSGEKSTTTNSTGGYSFTSLAAGTYRVRQVVKSGYRATLPSTGYHDITLSSGQTTTGKNFGDTTNILISGMVFNDANGNGVKESTETTGLSGWTVFIDADKDGIFDSGEKSRTTTTAGTFSFGDLSAGTYVVRIVAKSTHRTTTPTGGLFNITLTSGQSATNKLFGEKLI